MKRIIYNVLIISLIGCFYSCEEDNYDIDFKSTRIDNSVIAGVWYHSYEIDSLVLVFEDDNLKEYVFNKKNEDIISRVNHGRYSLSRYKYNNGRVTTEIFLPEVDSTSLLSTFTVYDISGDILTIHYKNYTQRDFYKVK